MDQPFVMFQFVIQDLTPAAQNAFLIVAKATGNKCLDTGTETNKQLGKKYQQHLIMFNLETVTARLPSRLTLLWIGCYCIKLTVF